MNILLSVLIGILAYVILIPIAKWHKKRKQEMWDQAVMYDCEYDQWFSHHPYHPNYKPKKDK